MRTETDFHLAAQYMAEYSLEKLGRGPLLKRLVSGAGSGLEAIGKGMESVGGGVAKLLKGKVPKVAPRPLPGGVPSRVMTGPIPSEAQLATLPKAFPPPEGVVRSAKSQAGTAAARPTPVTRNPSIPPRQDMAAAMNPPKTIGMEEELAAANIRGAHPAVENVKSHVARRQAEADLLAGVAPSRQMPKVMPRVGGTPTSMPGGTPSMPGGGAPAARPVSAGPKPPPLPISEEATLLPKGVATQSQIASASRRASHVPLEDVLRPGGGMKPWEATRGAPIDLGGGRVAYTSATWNKLTETMSKFASVYAHSPLFQLRMGA